MGTSSPIRYSNAYTHRNPDNLVKRHNPPRRYTRTGRDGNKTCAKNCVKHIILCPGRGHDSPHGPQLHRNRQTKATNWTLGWCMQLLDYLASNDITKVRFHALDMIMSIHSDTLYLLAPGERSCTCGHFFHGVDAEGQRTNKIKQSLPHKHGRHVICCGSSSGGLTRGIIP